MTTVLQLKAARVLLGWKQADLAKASGISLAALAGIEQGKGKSRSSTMEAITTALENAGIEFLPDPGVRLRKEKFNLRVLEGRESILELWADIEFALAATGGEVLISGVDESTGLTHYTKEEIGQSLKRRRALGIYNRILICEGDNTVLIGPDVYRSISRALFQQTPYYVYADRLAIISWGPPQRVLLIHNALIAETFRRQFEFNWQTGHKLDPRKVAVVSLGLAFEKQPEQIR